ncbi:MAG: hypothetical protein SNJ33_00675 [Rikenellaceae bacterium]
MKADKESRDSSEVATTEIKAIAIVGGIISITSGVYIVINGDLSGYALIACGVVFILLTLAL